MDPGKSSENGDILNLLEFFTESQTSQPVNTSALLQAVPKIFFPALRCIIVFWSSIIQLDDYVLQIIAKGSNDQAGAY